MSDAGCVIRAADPDDDAAACAGIYAPYVTSSVASFETEVPDRLEMRRRIVTSHAWLVAVDEEGEVVAYAYGSRHHERAAYRWTADVAVYVSSSHQGRGVGRAIYGELLAALRDQGFWTVCALIVVPNPGSDALHRAMGFEPAGVLARVGYKDGAWRDVSFWQLDLRPGDSGPPEG